MGRAKENEEENANEEAEYKIQKSTIVSMSLDVITKHVITAPCKLPELAVMQLRVLQYLCNTRTVRGRTIRAKEIHYQEQRASPLWLSLDTSSSQRVYCSDIIQLVCFLIGT
jgi:hypothetical protein